MAVPVPEGGRVMVVVGLESVWSLRAPLPIHTHTHTHAHAHTPTHTTATHTHTHTHTRTHTHPLTHRHTHVHTHTHTHVHTCLFFHHRRCQPLSHLGVGGGLRRSVGAEVRGGERGR